MYVYDVVGVLLLLNVDVLINVIGVEICVIVMCNLLVW